ncbi:MAG: tRNA pseudouridine(55) synthase TruB [Fibrobacter sp.]|nr:tRNA pseudouridine(55) synthase TruB [Fibrobacter sp.]
MDGFLCIDKPCGPSSFQMVNRIRRLLRVSRAGHAGTLDPAASGVLIIALGSATRLLRFIDSEPKTYSFGIQFGTQTDTLDSEGQVTCSGGPIPDRSSIENAVSELTGDQLQVPPDYSAVKINGVRAYKMAREGKKLSLQARPVKIHSFEILSYDSLTGTGELKVCCTGGTYVRSIVRDLSLKTGTFGYATSIRRLGSGRFTVDNSVAPQNLEMSADYIISPSELFRSSPSFQVPSSKKAGILNGIDIDIGKESDSEVIFAYCEDRLIAVLKRKTATVFHPVVVLSYGVEE